jgi:hypothetical protein
MNTCSKRVTYLIIDLGELLVLTSAKSISDLYVVEIHSFSEEQSGTVCAQY